MTETDKQECPIDPAEKLPENPNNTEQDGPAQASNRPAQASGPAQGSNAPTQPTTPGQELSATGRPIAANWKQVIGFIWGGQAFSILTSYAALYAALWYIVTITEGSAMMLAVVSILTMLPTGLLSPFAGVLADRVNRRLIMIVADAGVGVVSVILAMIIFFGYTDLPVIIVVLMIRSVGQAFHTPAMTAAMPMLVPERHLVRINTMSQMLWSFAGILSPAIGIFILTSFGLEFALLLDALGAVIAVIGMAMVKIPTVRDVAMNSKHIFANMADGLRVIGRNRGLVLLTVVCTVDMILFMPIGSLYPLMTFNHFGPAFGNDEAVLGYLASVVEAVFGIVMLLSSFVLLAWGGGKRHTLIVINCGLGIGITTLAMGLLNSDQFWVFVAISGVMAIFCAFYNGPMMTIYQRHTPEEKMGRVMGVVGSMMSLVSPLGLVLAGLFADPIGIDNWFLISGIVMVVLIVPVYFLRPIRNLDKS